MELIIEYVGTSFPKLHGMVYNDLKRLSITLHPVIIFHLLATPYLTIYSSLQQTHQNRNIKTIHHVQIHLYKVEYHLLGPYKFDYH